MIMWGFPALICALVASALLLRRRPLLALAVTLAGSVASMAQPTIPASAGLVVVVCAAGLEICYLAATRTRRVSVTGVVMAGAGLADSAPSRAVCAPTPGPEWGADRLRCHDRRTPCHDHCLVYR